FIDNHERTIAPLAKDYNLRFWELSIDGNSQRESALIEARQRYVDVYSNREDFRELQNWNQDAVALPELAARQYRLLYDSYVPHQIDPEVLHDLVRRETEIENAFNTFRAEFEGDRVSDNQLRDVLRGE